MRRPMTVDEKRALLRQYMEECPACVPGDADGIADDELDTWLDSHEQEGTML